MIWFACKKCGKTHGRPESLSGTLVFCECSFGNRVPWSSTAAEPEQSANPVPIPPSAPRPRPRPDRDEDDRSNDRPLRRREPRRANPRYCLNHEDAASECTCHDCKAAFCSSCVVTLQGGETLCGPCKNFRVRGITRPPRMSGLSIVALVVGLVGGPVTFCLNNINVGAQQTSPSIAVAIALSVVGLILPAGRLALAWLALREMDAKPNTGGRSLALTGAASGLIGVLWTLTIGSLLVYKHMQG